MLRPHPVPLVVQATSTLPRSHDRAVDPFHLLGQFFVGFLGGRMKLNVNAFDLDPECPSECEEPVEDFPARRCHRLVWAQLSKRGVGIDAHACPACEGGVSSTSR